MATRAGTSRLTGRAPESRPHGSTASCTNLCWRTYNMNCRAALVPCLSASCWRGLCVSAAFGVLAQSMAREQLSRTGTRARHRKLPCCPVPAPPMYKTLGSTAEVVGTPGVSSIGTTKLLELQTCSYNRHRKPRQHVPTCAWQAPPLAGAH